MRAPDAKRLCEQCGLELPPAGGCPHCLLRLGLSDNATAEDSESRLPPTGLQSRFFGDYEILDEISRGGMGVVYRARHLNLKRVMALKMIQSSQWVSPEARLRFGMEVAAAAQLNHPNIVALYESGEFKGAQFFTMRLVEGGTLAQHIRAARPDGVAAPACEAPPLASTNSVAGLLIKIARAVHHAHQRGILHRDLKPSNILIDSQGEPHVADFGLAKMLAQDSAATFTESVLGSPNYMAPEQAAGKRGELTTATDVYGLGAILYEALTGAPPFQAATPVETIRKVVDDEPVAPRKLNPSLDADLETICLKCLRKQSAARYGTAEELAEDLDRWQRGLAIRARPVGPLGVAWRWSRRHPGFVVLVGALVTALAAIAIGTGVAAVRIGRAERIADTRLRHALLQEVRVAHLSQDMGNREEAFRLLREAVAPAGGSSLSADQAFRDRARDELLTAIARTDMKFVPWTNWRGSPDPLLALPSPDGTRVATVLDGTNVVLLAMSDRSEQLRFNPGATTVTRLERFSPNGRFLVLRCAGGLDIWDLQTNQRAFATNHEARAVAFLHRPDFLLIGEDFGQLSLRGLPGLVETQRYLTEPDVSLQGQLVWRHLAVSSDDRLLAAVLQGEAVVNIINLETRRTVRRLTNTAPVNALAWRPNSAVLACAVSDGRIAVWNARSGRRQVNMPPGPGQALSVTFNPTGHLLAAAYQGRTLRVLELDAMRTAFEMPCDARLAGFSTSGNRLGPVFRGNEPGWFELSEPTEFHEFTVSTTSRDLLSCRFAADSRLVMIGGADFVDFADVETGGKPQGLTRMTASTSTVDPRGEILLAASASSLLRWTRVEGESNRFEMTRLAGSLPGREWRDIAFSADGGKLAAAHSQSDVAVLLDRTFASRLAEYGPHPGVDAVALSPDQRWLATGSSGDRQVKVWSTTTASNLFTFAAGAAPRPIFSGDGRWLVVSGTVFDLRDTRSWKAAPPLPFPEGKPVTGAVAFSADARWLAVICDLTTVHLFDLITFQRLGVLRGPRPMQTHGVAFSPDGHWLVTVGSAGRLRAWNLTRLRQRLGEFELDWDLPPLHGAQSEGQSSHEKPRMNANSRESEREH